MMRAPRCLPTTTLWLVLGLLPTTAAFGAADGLRYTEVHKALDGTVGLNGVLGVAVSPDGKSVYTASLKDDAVDVFRRDNATGRLTFVEMHQHVLAAVDGLNGASVVAVSPDGRNVYVGSFIDDMLLGYSRDPDTGALTFLEMIEDGEKINGVDINGLDGPTSMAMTPDGKFLYVAANKDDAVSVFARDPDTGLLRWVEVQKNGDNSVDGIDSAFGVAISPDGAHVYVTGSSPRPNENALGALVVFRRDQVTGVLSYLETELDLTDGVEGLDKARGVAVSPDGSNVYVVGGRADALVIFQRNPATGSLTFLMVEHDNAGGVDGLNGPVGVAVSPDGLHVYAMGDVDNSMAFFERNPLTGLLTFIERKHDGVGGVDGLNNAAGVAISPDSLSVYTTGFVDDAVAVFRVRFCGDGVLDPREQCDDGNTQSGDCCSSTCQVEAAGNLCTDDGNGCTDDRCSAGGTCQHTNNTAPCNDGAFCTLGDTCQGGVCHGSARNCSAAAADQCHNGVCDDNLDACVSQVKTDGATCQDGNKCTQHDTCQSGSCTAGDPVICNLDQCHGAGTCDTGTGLCPNPQPEGTPCNDNDACTHSDTCQAGNCTGADPVVCTASDQCHDAGTCNAGTGVCSNPSKANGSPCSDGNACSQTDTCSAGVCHGQNPVVCLPQDTCHRAGTCNPGSGACSNPLALDGSSCDDGSACTRADSCHGGVCTGADPVECPAADQCHGAGVCNAATGQCAPTVRPDGTVCDDGNASTEGDVCRAGTCQGGALADRDGDGVGDATDVCADISDADQTDSNDNGAGDACECASPAPGRCVAGGGPAAADCLVEFNPHGAIPANPVRTAVLRCRDGDAACDRDGMTNGKCTFGFSVCLANSDPRIGGCKASGVTKFEVMSPSARRSKSALDRSNAVALENMVGTLGVEVRRGGLVVTPLLTPSKLDRCSRLVDLAVPAPAGKKPSRRIIKVRGTAADGRVDADKLTLECVK